MEIHTAQQLRDLAYVVDLDIQRIYNQLLQRARVGYLHLDFDVYQPHFNSVLSALQQLFPDTVFTRTRTMISHYTYRASWHTSAHVPYCASSRCPCISHGNSRCPCVSRCPCSSPLAPPQLR